MDVFATIVTPAAYKTDAVTLAAGAMSFSAKFTTDTMGAPPPTHYMSSGNIPQEIRDVFVADGRFTVSDQPWTVVAAQLGITKVVYVD